MGQMGGAMIQMGGGMNQMGGGMGQFPMGQNPDIWQNLFNYRINIINRVTNVSVYMLLTFVKSQGF